VSAISGGGQSSASPKQRTKGRELALKYLYQVDARGGVDPEPFDSFAAHQEESGLSVEFARQLVTGVMTAKVAIDERIGTLARNWSMDRMAVIDRNILRIGAFELMMPAAPPPAVVINEAVELGKRFSTAQSGKFINGILDKLRASDVASPPTDKKSED
jgi:transcription antitermination protein NusB